MSLRHCDTTRSGEFRFPAPLFLGADRGQDEVQENPKEKENTYFQNRLFKIDVQQKYERFR